MVLKEIKEKKCFIWLISKFLNVIQLLIILILNFLSQFY